MSVPLIVVIVVLTALAFDFTNGFHDTANAMATSIATGALKPKVAVAIAGVLNVVGAFLSVKVASTISSGIVDETKFSHTTGPYVVFGALIGAIIWNLITWYLGLPSSSSHALFGGLIGAAWVAFGTGAVHFTTIVEKVIIPAVASPLVAGVVAMIATYLAYTMTQRTRQDTVKRGFRAGQTVSASLVALAHGTNDAQKTMGVITLTFIVAGIQPNGANPFWWVILLCGLAIGSGTYIGGWRIIRTLGKGITDVETQQGFAAEASSAATILASSHLGFALSTTHVVSGGVIGSGLGRRLAEVRWSVAGKMAIAWILTLPAAAVVGALAGKAASGGPTGTVIVALVGIIIGGGIFAASRRNPVNAKNVNDAKTLSPTPEPAEVGA
ncbi:MAG TPA: inorganic phosphate transporter [Pseudonocardiaceae bacterium]|nr:inorganic phosphate transporter [Pseudonocardiaceae bacterium]